MQGPRQPTQANEGHSAAINDRYVCFLVYILFFVFLLLQSPRRPTAANEGQCRPTKTKKAPPALHRHQRVMTTCWWLPRPPSALHHHQRVTTTRWWSPRAPSAFQSSTTTNESRRLVGGGG